MSRKELDLRFLQYYRLVSRWACKTHDLNIADFELLLYLHPIEYFTIDDFKTGQLLVSWDKTRFYRLIKQDWIKKIHSGSGRVGGHSKYTTTTQTLRLLNRVKKMLEGNEPIPTSERRNKIMKGSSYSDKVYREAIKQFNKNRNNG